MSESSFAMDGTAPLPDRADVVILGGGPGGLACAKALAQAGAQVLLLERKPCFGRKVCAGGITASGMLRLLPQDLIERAFPAQHLVSPLQRIKVAELEPIIATVNRERLGQWMAQEAQEAGAALRTGVHALALTDKGLILRDAAGKVRELVCEHLVGADGARSLVRRTLGLSSRLSIGLNAMLPIERQEMEWHLNPRLFASGYAWIFPHGRLCSVGAFSDANLVDAKTLRENLQAWAARQGLHLEGVSLQAGWVNYDFQGLRFGKRWLVGDAAGLSSALTGEGIYPAVCSGEAVAAMILSAQHNAPEMDALVKRHAQHRKFAALAGRGRVLPLVLAELLLVLLRLHALDFRRLEMAAPMAADLSEEGTNLEIHDCKGP